MNNKLPKIKMSSIRGIPSKLFAAITVLLLVFSIATPLVSAAVLKPFTYTPLTNTAGVIEKDRYDFMNADGNPLKEDIANTVFQGPGVFQSFKDSVWRNETIYDDSVGFMKDIYLTITNYGTLTKMNYTGEEIPPYHWLPVIEQNPPCIASGITTAPLEGWAIAYNITTYPYGYDEGYLVLTFSGFTAEGKLVPNVIGQDSDDNWSVSVQRSTWVNNPRLLALLYNVSAVNLGSGFKPKFMLEIVVVFNKATKFVEIFQRLTLVDWSVVGCVSAVANMALARMAIFDANPYCDRAFYGWKNVAISDPEFFLVLSWTNKTLSKWVRSDLGWDYYGAYMASYPIPDSWAIASTWYDSNDTSTSVDACDVWNAPQLRYTPIYLNISGPKVAGYLDKYVMLYMGDIDGDEIGDGDQALVRVEWYADASGMPEEILNLSTDWKMIMYGVYDVNGTGYDGGEGGWFKYGYLCLSNGTAYGNDEITNSNIVPVNLPVPPPDPNTIPEPWTHTGTLGWLNKQVSDEYLTSSEKMLTKNVQYLDIDQDGNKGTAETNDKDPVTATDEVNIPFEWWPTEELYWQLTYKFAPPVFKKIPSSTCCMFSQGEDEGGPMNSYNPETGEVIRAAYDFTVVPAPGATPDAAGAAWLNARFTSMLVTFDVEAYNMIATVGYTNPATKMLPYLMLRLTSIPASTEDYPARKAHYLTADRRALPQMEWEDRNEDHCVTPWLDKHYLLVTVAGVHPNLVTYYFNDFTPITFAVGGDYQGDIVVLPYTGPIDTSPYIGTDLGKGVIALAKDHFNNIALIVYGLDAQDTYWTAFIATHDWPYIKSSYGDWQALLIGIDYTMGHEWGDGDGIPTAHPTYFDIFFQAWLEARAIEYESELCDWYWWD